MRLLTLLFLILIVSTATAEAQEEPETGYDVLKAMYDRYAGEWYERLTFTQKTTFYGQDGDIQRVQTWFEALELPGKLAIKFDEKTSGNGILFNNKVQYGYANGRKIQEIRRIHELLVIGFDVYHQHPDSTATQLASLNYDLQKVYEDEWQGRANYVIGIDEPDSSLNQIWIDKEHLYFVKSISSGRQNIIQEVQFKDYEKLGGGWIAPTVIFKANGFTGLLEEYSDITIPDSLNSAIFDPFQFTTASWN